MNINCFYLVIFLDLLKKHLVFCAKIEYMKKVFRVTSQTAPGFLRDKDGHMKKILASLLVAGMLLVGASVALAKTITVVNGTNFEIHGIALSPSETDNWGNDLLGNDVLKPGEGLQIQYQGDDNNWDLAAVDPEGNQVSFTNLSFRGASQVVLHSDATATLQ